MPRIIKQRDSAVAQLSSVHPLLGKIYSARSVVSEDELDCSASQLLSPKTLKGIDAGASLLAAAVAEQKKVVIVADFDADGATMEEKYALPPNYRRVETKDEFKYFVNRILAAVNVRNTQYHLRKHNKKISDIFSVSDEAFALLLLFNEFKRWNLKGKKLADKPNSAGILTPDEIKETQKPFTGGNIGDPQGFSLEGRKVYSNLYEQVERLRDTRQSRELEQKILEEEEKAKVCKKERRRNTKEDTWNVMETVNPDSSAYELLMGGRRAPPAEIAMNIQNI